MTSYVNPRKEDMFIDPKRVIDWNKARYLPLSKLKNKVDQRDAVLLEQALVREETQELLDELQVHRSNLEGDTNYKVLHEGLDVIYVVIGILWKHGFSQEQIVKAYNTLCDCNDKKASENFKAHIKVGKSPGVNTLNAIIESIRGGKDNV